MESTKSNQLWIKKIQVAWAITPAELRKIERLRSKVWGRKSKEEKMSWVTRRKNRRPRLQDPEDEAEDHIKNSIPHSREDERDFYREGGGEAVEEVKESSREERRSRA